MNNQTRVDVEEVLGQMPVGGYRIAVFALAVLLAMLDGIDNVTLGLVAPALSAELQIPKADLAAVFTATLVGLTVGAMVLGPAGDKRGRRPAILACAAFFGVFTLAIHYVQGLNMLILFRFLAGIGIGGLLPNICALVSEYSPNKHKQTGVLVVSGGIAAGAMLGGILASFIEPAFGWRSLFMVAGGITIFALLVAIVLLPESIRFMAARNPADPDVYRLLKRAVPSADIPRDARWIVSGRSAGGTFRQLFAGGMAVTTIVLWVSYILVLSTMYLLFQWLPTLARDFGFSPAMATYASTVFNLGGMVGSIILGPMAARWGAYRVSAINFLLIIPGVIALAYSRDMQMLLLFSSFVTGWTIMGGLGVINALTTDAYPTASRSTGLGWASGVGPLGSSLSPSFIGWLMVSDGWTPHDILMLPIVPAIILTIAVVTVGSLNRKQAATLSGIATTHV